MNMNAAEIYERIEAAKSKAGRTDKVLFVAVSKTRTVEEMKAVEEFACIDYFGENRVQEGEAKRKAYGPSRLEWRLIGHLQANKARKAVELFDAIDSIDSVELAQRVDRIAGELGKVMPVLVEVNTSGEASKSGVGAEGCDELVEYVAGLGNVRLEGLMTVGPLTEDAGEVRRAFSELRELCERARVRTGLMMPVLSMGMSGDYEAAIEEGSTMVRIGTLLFGARVYK